MRRRCTPNETRERVAQVFKLRLAGAQFHDVKEYAQAPEQAWQVSESQLHRYMQAADRLIRERASRDADFVFARSITRRDQIYSQAMAAGDFRTALDADRDLDKLFGLYPEAQAPGRDRPQTNVTLNIQELTVTAPELPPPTIREEIVLAHDHNGHANGSAGPDSQAAPGPGGLPEE
jgi:hypothetical protein